MTPVPLVVDLDGTLIRTDLLVESFLGLAAASPVKAIAALTRLGQGKAAFKAHLADEVMIEVQSLPLDAEVLAMVQEAHGEGRPVWIASASDERYVRALADHLGLFEGVIGSGNGINLKAKAKADALVERFGAQGFDYVGNHRDDLPIWRVARRAYLAGGSRALHRRLVREHDMAEALKAPAGGAKGYIRALRPHQWLKNILIFVPPLAGHTLRADLVPGLIAFVAFCLCASSVYITNDLLDLTGDRQHPRKRNRPFASGQIPALNGMAIAVLALIAAFGLSLLLPGRFTLALFGYYTLTFSYSLILKRKAIVDVIVLAVLYGARVAAGGYATGVTISPWLEALCAFLFLSLALVKRCAELIDRQKTSGKDPAGRGYRITDLPVLEAMAAAAGYNAALVLALYVNNTATLGLYSHPHRLWLLCLLLLTWLARILLLTRRGEMHDDPVIFAVKDRVSLLLGLCCAAVVVSAL